MSSQGKRKAVAEQIPLLTKHWVVNQPPTVLGWDFRLSVKRETLREISQTYHELASNLQAERKK